MFRETYRLLLTFFARVAHRIATPLAKDTIRRKQVRLLYLVTAAQHVLHLNKPYSVFIRTSY